MFPMNNDDFHIFFIYYCKSCEFATFILTSYKFDEELSRCPCYFKDRVVLRKLQVIL